jgi:sugar (pentulose or hexulose) kinase
MLSLTADELTACIDDLARRYARGAIDLDTVPLVLPQFRGSPPPDKNAAARGVVAGVRSDTTAADIVLGCFLGMALQFRDVLGLFDRPVERVKVIGPAAVNPLWLQLKADLLGVALSVSRFPEVVSRGAQALASGETVPWARSEPREVEVDPRNAERVAAWAASVGPRWEHMKAMPW